MSLVVNHNMMAAGVARNLNAHYGRLATSTERLSTGLRVNSAADDAAGLAIRELMRADIASLHQGARNANDAISMIQTADGALGVIDEKLIRMKELAEQAATGTYDSTQRMMIESEYQQMASEITRIANATDFNGIHLLNGNLSATEHNGSGLNSTGKLKIHFGAGNDSAEDYYYININECTAQAFGVGSASTWEDASNRIISDFTLNFNNKMKDLLDANKVTSAEYADDVLGDNSIPNRFAKALAQASLLDGNTENFEALRDRWLGGDTTTEFVDEAKNITYGLPDKFESMSNDDYAKLSDRDKQKIQYAFGKAFMYNFNTYVDSIPSGTYPTGTAESNYTYDSSDFDDVDDLYSYVSDIYSSNEDEFNAISGATDEAYSRSQKTDYAGMTIASQEDAQIALNAINNAIVEKDKIRANLGATQNRLENTITNINTQAENLQASESRISDVDVSTEMTEFVRNQILTQSAVAMLSQANSLPQMAMQLIGG